ncbi:hypothetical protein IIA94_02370, partial [Patescibacteria group bacterium]|nr:hypothetical protein [Patescibacteria group bacterium]
LEFAAEEVIDDPIIEEVPIVEGVGESRSDSDSSLAEIVEEFTTTETIKEPIITEVIEEIGDQELITD